MILNMDEISSPLPPRKVSVEETPPTVVSTEVKKAGSNINIKWIAGGIGGIILILILALGLSKIKSGVTNEAVTLNYWGLWEDESVMNGVIADFEEKNPKIKVKYVYNQRDDYRTRLKAKLNKGGAEAPDVFRIHANWLPMFTENLAAVPGNTVTSLQLENDFFEVYKEALRKEGSWRAVPLMYDGLGLYYNKDLIDAAGVSLPKGWWNLQEAASRLTVKDGTGRIKIAGVAMGLTENVDHWSDIIGVMMKQAGIDPLKNDKENQDKLQSVLTYYSLFKTKVGTWDESLPASTLLFIAGKLGFYFGPSWRMFEIDDQNPNLKYEIMPVPQFPTMEGNLIEQTNSEGSLTNIHWASYWVEGVNTKGEHQKEAWKFLEYMASKDGLSKMYQTASQIRSFGEIYPRKSMAAEISSNLKLKTFVETADQATSWYLTSRTFDQGLNDEMITYFQNAINKMVINGAAATDVMPDLTSGINQLIQKYQIK